MFLLLGLAGCGQEPTIPSDVYARAAAQGASPELIYGVELPGYSLAEQSAGVHGDDGFQVAYISSESDTAWLTVTDESIDAQSCPQLPIPHAEPEDALVKCAEEGSGWYRVAGDRHEYAAVRDGHLLRLSADRDTVARDALVSAVLGARAASQSRAEESFADERRSPVERGDLPEVGDGAPDNSVGAGG